MKKLKCVHGETIFPCDKCEIEHNKNKSALSDRVIILATELAETWWTAVYFERDDMPSWKAEQAGKHKATTEYERFMPNAEKLLERIKL